MSVVKKRRRKLPDLEHCLIADIHSSKFSYFIASHRFHEDSERIDDEAIIELNAEISEIRPPQREHVGEHIECSLICSRSYSRSDVGKNDSGVPVLFSVILRRRGRTMLAYLPADAFWAIQARLAAGKMNKIEACYKKPWRGSGDLTSLYVSTT
jgi:hypothetical protein